MWFVTASIPSAARRDEHPPKAGVRSSLHINLGLSATDSSPRPSTLVLSQDSLGRLPHQGIDSDQSTLRAKKSQGNPNPLCPSRRSSLTGLIRAGPTIFSDSSAPGWIPSVDNHLTKLSGSLVTPWACVRGRIPTQQGHLSSAVRPQRVSPVEEHQRGRRVGLLNPIFYHAVGAKSNIWASFSLVLLKPTTACRVPP
jgi:hypothetical protein